MNVPAGMTIVSEERFFAALYADRRDIMPTCHVSPDYTPWRTTDGTEIARTLPGWRNPGEPKVYMMRDSLGK